MKLTIKDINQLLEAEIKWCLDNPDNELNKDQQLGFMNGLRQAEYLIEKAENILLNATEFISYTHSNGRLLLDIYKINRTIGGDK